MRPHNEIVITAAAETIMQDALELPPVEKAELIERLFQSFDAPHKTKTNAEWAVEFESRLNACKEGKIKASPKEEVMKSINRR